MALTLHILNNMENKDKNGVPNDVLKCYISSFIKPKIDADLERYGIAKGMLAFAIPNFGVLFKCRTEGKLLEMEFAAFFALLEFLTTKLNEEKITKVHVLSSLPHFIFSVSGSSNFMKANSSYRQILERYTRKLIISVGYIKPQQNEALKPASLFPILPLEKKININMSKSEFFKTDFKSIQRGIKL